MFCVAAGHAVLVGLAVLKTDHHETWLYCRPKGKLQPV